MRWTTTGEWERRSRPRPGECSATGRPGRGYAGTDFHLGCALKDVGRLAEAVAAWGQALRLAPEDRLAREELFSARHVLSPEGV